MTLATESKERAVGTPRSRVRVVAVVLVMLAGVALG